MAANTMRAKTLSKIRSDATIDPDIETIDADLASPCFICSPFIKLDATGMKYSRKPVFFAILAP